MKTKEEEPCTVTSVVNNRGEFVLFTTVFRIWGGNGVPNWDIPNTLPLKGLQAAWQHSNRDDVPAQRSAAFNLIYLGKA